MRRRQKRSLLRGGRGTTLVELVMVCALLVLLTGLIAALLGPMLMTARQSKALSEDRMIAKTIAAHAANELRFASPGSIELSGDSAEYRNPTFGAARIENANGRVSVMAGEDELGLEEDAYMGREAAISFEQADDTHLTLTVVVTRGGAQTYRISEEVRLLNEGISGEP